MGRLINNTVLVFIVAILLLSNIAMLTYFVWMKHPAKNVHSERQRSPVSAFLEKQVGFNSQQMEEFEKLRQQHRQKIRPLFENLRLAKMEFYQLLKDTTVGDSILHQKASVVGERQKQLDLQAFQNFRDIRAICTPEQKPRYDSLVPGVVSKMWYPPRRTSDREKEATRKKSGT